MRACGGCRGTSARCAQMPELHAQDADAEKLCGSDRRPLLDEPGPCAVDVTAVDVDESLADQQIVVGKLKARGSPFVSNAAELTPRFGHVVTREPRRCA